MSLFTRLSAALLLLLIPGNSFGEDNSAALFSDVEIRVVLARAAVSVKIDGDDGLSASSAQSGAMLNTGAMKTMVVQPHPQGIKINSLVFPVPSIRIESPSGNVLFNGKRYRGYMVLWENGKGTFDAVNHLPLEDYLRSVVAMEMPKSWPLEAQKAQAVAARTYAMFKRQENAANSFDVETDVNDQAYGGFAAENEFTDLAVRATAGMVLLYDNRIARAYFHANSGERTENGIEVFRGVEEPYLKSVPCQFASHSTYYAWQLNLHLSEIETALSHASLFRGQITGISVGSHTKTGRVRVLRITGPGGRTELVEAVPFRQALGSTRLKSTRFTIRRTGKMIIFNGTGYGHGVGLCQWGAKGMAEHNHGFREILSHYYPGTTLATGFTGANPE